MVIEVGIAASVIGTVIGWWARGRHESNPYVWRRALIRPPVAGPSLEETEEFRRRQGEYPDTFDKQTIQTAVCVALHMAAPAATGPTRGDGRG